MENLKFKGTPGPWFIRDYPSDLVHIAKGSEDNVEKDFCTVWNISHPEILENAKLMAAAPELLESLQYCLKALKAITILRQPETIIKAAEKAIEKALK